MNNIIKKISAIAMAFTLLGTGTAVTKSVAPKYDISIVASAADVTTIFSDVKADDWFVGAVQFVYDKGIMVGTGNKFEPRKNLKREEFAQVLYNYAGKPSIGTATTSFQDVDKNAWYYNAVVWAHTNKVVSGYSETKFGINDNVTREQAVQMLYNYAMKSKNYETASTNSGAANGCKMSDWAKKAMDWAVSNQIVKKQDSTFMYPKSNALRAECAQLIKNFVESILPLQQKNYEYSICSSCNATISSAGCGAMATVNAVYYLTGKHMDESVVAKKVKENNQHAHTKDENGNLIGAGLSHDVPKVLANALGNEYGFKCSASNKYSEKNYPTDAEYVFMWNDLRSHLTNGEVAVALVKGHFIAIVDYDSRSNTVLVYDSAASDKRGTTTKGDWKSCNELNYHNSEGKTSLKLRNKITYLSRA